MEKQLHRLLQRQIRKHFSDAHSIPDELKDFLSSVNLAYSEFDSDLKYFEGILEQSMRELFIANNELQTKVDVSEKETEILRDEIENIVDNINEVVFKTDLNGNWVYLNSAWEKLTGISVEDSLGSFSLNLLESKHAKKINEDFTSLLKSTRTQYNRTVSFTSSKGEDKWLSIKAKVLTGSDKRVMGLIGTIADVTEKHLAEEKVKWLAAVIEKTNNTVIITDADKHIIWVNNAFEKLTGYSLHESLGESQGSYYKESILI